MKLGIALAEVLQRISQQPKFQTMATKGLSKSPSLAYQFYGFAVCTTTRCASDLEEMWADIYAWLIFLDSHCASNGVYIERLRAMCSRERTSRPVLFK